MNEDQLGQLPWLKKRLGESGNLMLLPKDKEAVHDDLFAGELFTPDKQSIRDDGKISGKVYRNEQVKRNLYYISLR